MCIFRGALESLYKIRPFTSVPLTDQAEYKLIDEANCREYINAFVDNIVVRAKEDDCIEAIDLEFQINEDAPLHQPIIAAITLLNALLVYEVLENQNEHNHISLAMEALEPALNIANWSSRNTVSVN